MFRLAFFGVACLALAACALVRIPLNSLPESLSLDKDQTEDRNRLRGTLIRIPAQRFHALFSVN